MAYDDFFGQTVSNGVASGSNSYTWLPPVVNKRVTKVTETMEYDEKGRVVKKTVVTETTEDVPTTTTQPYIMYNNSTACSCMKPLGGGMQI